MGYQALYRVWRPQRFEDLIGQKMITQTLKNAISTGQTSHAYLFTGPRGTGKTSAAKIFAKALNCHHQKNGEPCNECDICRAITEGRLNDVIEIDAASNNSVDEVRDIRDKVKYAPTQADYKVYIIDEVHMLSAGAFNALLKTLEEPPANVVFILATTEPHKIPATIISRTQRFDFRRIDIQDIYTRMAYILEQDKLTYEKEALKVIAKAAAGGMRDALSILDQVISFGGHKVTLQNALLVTGSVTHEKLQKYLQEIFAHQTAQALQELQLILDEGKNANRFIEDIIDYYRTLLLFKTAPEILQSDEDVSESADFKKMAAESDAQLLYRAIDILNEQQQSMRFSTHTDVYLEVLTVKLAQLKVNDADESVAATTVAKLQEQLQGLTQQVRELKKQGSMVSNTNMARATSSGTKAVAKKGSGYKSPKVELEKVYPILANATRDSLVQLKGIWGDLMAMLSVTQRAIMNITQPVAASNSGVIVSFKYDFLCEKAMADEELLQALTSGLERLVGDKMTLVFITQTQWPKLRQKYLVEHKEELENNNNAAKAEAVEPPKDEVVDQAKKIFGEEIVEVKED
ncbi:DNA polymerase III subunit gamma/tau [Liquorilactobacillus capillatus]|uniref:DNA-directed DNA polymerase n=1 Tax=Liquorilactobacillus capillatus DSM 19910 TaxID=1423731 RepID=A0A0R1M4Y3_9LACO|nr:DNA polymerase III subunit gamma/tau [Liquorilactobacillus capillatus]KRL02873.1 DNA polymerase III subunits gamma and tau [Liquorilactobacillus capillatus DSM 19910]